LSGRRPDPARAWALVRDLERLDGATAGRRYSPIFRRLVAASVSAAAGDRDRARAVLDSALKQTRGDEELSTDVLFDAAWVHFALGEREAGERELAAYLRARPDVAGFVLRDAPLRRVRGLR
jgi:hypothetical protein